MAFNISIGEMRQSGTLRNNNPVANLSGGVDDNYGDVITCRGKLRQQSGKKSIEQGEVVQNKVFYWTCRFQQGIVLNEDSIWVIGGQQYRITNWEKIDQINHWYEFTLNLYR
jgi:hypothetical protein